MEVWRPIKEGPYEPSHSGPSALLPHNRPGMWHLLLRKKAYCVSGMTTHEFVDTNNAEHHFHRPTVHMEPLMGASP